MNKWQGVTGAALAALALAAAAESAPAGGKKGDDVKIVEKWSGLYPFKKLDQLPKDQQTTGIGYIGDAKTFEAVWKAFKGEDKVPTVDFKDNLVVFVRNVNYVNSINITKVTILDGTVNIIAIQTLTARPIEDTLYIAFAVIPRKDVKNIQNGNAKVPVTD